MSLEEDGEELGIVDRLGEVRPVAEILAQFVKIIDPPNKRRKWTTSRIGFLRDGTPEPVLHVLARERYIGLDLRDHMVFWIDGCWENETWENVGVTGKAKGQRQVKNTIGVPSGTPEYWRRYRQIHAEKVKRYQAQARASMREKIERVREAEAERMRNDLAAQLGIATLSVEQGSEHKEQNGHSRELGESGEGGDATRDGFGEKEGVEGAGS